MTLASKDPGGGVISNLPNGVLRLMASPSANCTISGAGVACTLSFATVDAGSYIAGQIVCGYDAAPTGGFLRVYDYAGNTYLKIPITSAGPAPIDLSYLTIPKGKGLQISMGAPGGSVVGYLNAYPHAEK